MIDCVLIQWKMPKYTWEIDTQVYLYALINLKIVEEIILAHLAPNLY